MKNIINKYIAVGLVSVLPFASSCTDFLEQVNPNEMSTDSFWKTNTDLEMGLTAVYNAFKKSGVLSIADEYQRSDMCFPGYGRGGNISNVNYLQTFNESSNGPNNKWDALYQGVFRANQVIEAYDNLAPTLEGEDSQATAKVIVAQARFFRGLFYFYLHNSFNNGSVILYDKVPTDNDALFQKLETAETVRNFFLADLEYAHQNLPAKWEEKVAGKVTAGAAAAVLGKAHLYANEYDEAAVYFKDVIDNPAYGYALTEHIGDNFSEAGEFNSESILEISYSLAFKSEINIWDDEQSSTNLNYVFSPVGGWRSTLPSLWVANAYKNDPIDKNDSRNFIYDENGDIATDEAGDQIFRKYSLRTSYSIALVDDEDTPYYNVHPAEAAGFNNSEYAYFKKHTNWETHENERDIVPSQRSGINVRVIRLADVFLMYAECLIKGGADASGLEEAMMYVNKVRHRSALQLIGQATSSEFPSAEHNEQVYTAESLMDHLMYIERPLELSVEGNAIRHIDLRRWGITKQRFEELALEEYNGGPGTGYAFVDSNGEEKKKWGALLTEGPNLDNPSSTYKDFQEAAVNFNEATHAYWPIPNGESTANPNVN